MVWDGIIKTLKNKKNDHEEENGKMEKIILTTDDDIEYIIIDKNVDNDNEVKSEEAFEKDEDAAEKGEDKTERVEDTAEDIEKLSKEAENLDKDSEEVESSEEVSEEDLVEKANETDPVDKVESEEKEESEEVEAKTEEVKATETKKEASEQDSEEGSEEVVGEKVSSDDDEKLPSNKEVLEKLDLLNEYFKQKLLYDKHKETIIDNLHKEVQDYRDDMHLKIIKPLLMSIIQVKDSIEKTERIHREKNVEELDATKLLNLLASFAEELGDVLDMYNVVQYKEEGNSFKAIRQKIIKIEKTEDDKLDKTIKQSLSYGYELDGKVISPEKIVVYKKS